jgi:hypothetical protein
MGLASGTLPFRLELARCPDDLPDHVEPECERAAEPGEGVPAQIVDAGEQRRRDEQRGDDDGAADPGLGRYFVDELPQFLDVDVRQEVGARREELA